MRVIEHSGQRLRLQRNYQGALARSGSLLLLPAVCLLGFFGLNHDKTILACERPIEIAMTCQVIHSRLFGTEVQNWPADDVQKAVQATGTEPDGLIAVVPAPNWHHATTQVLRPPLNSRVVLITQGAPIALPSLTDDPQAILDKVNQINQFLSQPQQTQLRLESEQRGYTLLFGGILMALLYPWLLVDLMAVCSFDRGTGRFILQRRTLLNRHCIEHSLAEISSVQLHRQSVRGARAAYEVRVILRSGESFPLPLAEWQARQYYAELTQQIRYFLHFSERAE
jgi:hypothetical protein